MGNNSSNLRNRRIDLQNQIDWQNRDNDVLNANQNNLINTNNDLRIDYANKINAAETTNANLINNDKTVLTNINYSDKIISIEKDLNEMYSKIKNKYIADDNRANKIRIVNVKQEYKYLVEKNKTILNRYNYIKNQFTFHDNKFDYYSKTMDFLNAFYFVLFYLYYILLLVSIVILYLYKPEWSNYSKVFIIFITLIYPFFIYFLEKNLYILWIYIYSLASGNVYNNLSYGNKVVLNNTTDLTTGDD